MRNRSASMIFIFITVLVDVIGVGVIIPVGPDLVKDLSGYSLSDSASYVGLLMAAYAVMQFLFSPLLGTLSDRFGRRPILLIGLAGLSVDYLLHALAPSLEWLFVGRLLAGLCGATYTVAQAYAADVSTPETKAKNFGLIGAAFGLGFIIGPLIGGLAADNFGLRAPFYIAAGLTGLNFVYGLIILPESFPPEKRRAFKLSNANPLGSIKHLSRYRTLIGLVISFFFLHLAGQTLPAVWVLFTEYQFEWSNTMVSYSLAFVGLLVVIVQAGLIGKLVKLFGSRKVVMLGYIMWISGMILFSFATSGWMLFVFSIPYCLGGVGGPTLQSLISNQVSDREQGELQGALTSVMSLTSIITPIIMTTIFEVYTGKDAEIDFAGAPFVLASAFLIMSLIITVRVFRKRPELFDEVEVTPEPAD